MSATHTKTNKIKRTSKYNNDVCKNSNFMQNIYLDFINEGCENLRSNGSSHCSECSDNYKNGIMFVAKPKPKEDISFINVDEKSLLIEHE